MAVSHFGGKKIFNPLYFMEKTTSKEFAQGLLHSLKKFTDHFYEDFGQRAQTILGVKLDETQSATLKREIYMMNLWIISKILSREKKFLMNFIKFTFCLISTNIKLNNGWSEKKPKI